jgi:glucan phosphoethanolaminetransferase (alkaline phosphatase superfamily)
LPFAAEPSDVLLTLAEVAVAFAGFASIVAIFQVRWTREDVPFDLFRFWVMLAFSLATLLFALLPFLLHFLGLSDDATWRSCSALLALFVVANGVFIGNLVRRRVPTVVSSLTRSLNIGANTTYAVTLISQITNLLGVLGRPGFGLYLLGLLLILVGAGVNFVRLVWVASSQLNRPAA